MTDYEIGDKVVHPYNVELGVGVVRAVKGRRMTVYFKDVDQQLVLSTDAGLPRFILQPGTTVRELETDRELLVVASHGRSCTVDDGRTVPQSALWPVHSPIGPLEKLASSHLDPLDEFRTRIDGLRLAEMREANGVGRFLGGRIELLEHQLHTGLCATKGDPVRWLLADEVGLGKTIEACMIVAALTRTGRSSRCLVVAPEALVVQWLGELHQKFHQDFVLIDAARLKSTAVDFGVDFNPFDAYRMAIVSSELLTHEARLASQAVISEPDLVLVDEAHRFSQPGFHEAIAPLVKRSRHAMLLTATPLAAGLPGFHGLLELLHPDLFASYEAFVEQLENRSAVIPCTSALRRQDIGAFPKRVARRIDASTLQNESLVDPRLSWILVELKQWSKRGEKTVIFAESTETVVALAAALEKAGHADITLFHDRLDVAERDIQLARFWDSSQTLLLCSDVASEGRNLQRCHRILHYDLPRDPVRVEQRIGRLDRIGRVGDIEVLFFAQDGTHPDLATLYERLEIFSTPSAGVDAALAGVRELIARSGLDATPLDLNRIASDLQQVRVSVARSAPRAFYPDTYDVSKKETIRNLIPRELEVLTERYCVAAAERLGLKVVPKGGAARYYIELPLPPTGADFRTDRAHELLGADWETILTRVDGLPGVGITALPGFGNEVRFLGTFNRAEALENQSLAFFSNGQMLVEGLMMEFADSQRGRATSLRLQNSHHLGAGLLCIFERAGAWAAVTVDSYGNVQKDWPRLIIESLEQAEKVALPPTVLGRVEALRHLVEIAARSAGGMELHACAWIELSW